MPSLRCVSYNLYESRRTILDLYQGGIFFMKKLREKILKEVRNYKWLKYIEDLRN
jgi:hypothetical protein